MKKNIIIIFLLVIFTTQSYKVQALPNPIAGCNMRQVALVAIAGAAVTHCATKVAEKSAKAAATVVYKTAKFIRNNWRGFRWGLVFAGSVASVCFKNKLFGTAINMSTAIPN